MGGVAAGAVSEGTAIAGATATVGVGFLSTAHTPKAEAPRRQTTATLLGLTLLAKESFGMKTKENVRALSAHKEKSGRRPKR
jgi:hypothetical protein